MATAQLGTVVRHIRSVAVSQTSSEKSDGALLRAFLSGNDQTAFEALLLRHGPMVLRVCRRALHNAHDAEDVFQGTFLALAQHAASVRKCESLAHWLHGVAYRMATQAKRAAARRHKHESQASPTPPRDPALSAAWRELQALLHEEVAGLPATLHGPFVICCLENMGCAEAARRLGLQEGTVRMRLSRARKLLQERLARRGVCLTAVLAAAALDRQGVWAAVPRSLAASTAKAASQIIPGQAPPCGLISPRIVTLMQGVNQAMFFDRCKSAILLILCTALAGAGLGLAALCGARAEPPASSRPAAPAAASKEVRNARAGEADERSFGGAVIAAATGKPFKGAKVVVRRYEAGKYQRQTTHTSDAGGRFTFTVSAEEMARKGLRLAVSVEAAGHVGFPAGLATDQALAELRTGKGMGLRPHFDRMELFPLGQVSGTVVTPDGKPAAGVPVIACSVPQAGKFYHRLKIKGQTDNEGKFRIDVATPGAAFLYLLPEGYAARYLDLKLKRGDLGALTLEPGISLTGRVRDAKGKPLAGHWVRTETPLKRELDPNLFNVGRGFGRWVKTGANGEFRAAPLPPGEYAVRIGGHNVPDGTTHSKDPLTDADVPGKPVEGLFLQKKVTLTKGEKPEEFELRPVPHVILTVRASDSKGRPKAGLHVRIHGMLDGIDYNAGGAGTGPDGISRIKVPHGLVGPGGPSGPLVSIMTDCYRFRIKQGGPLEPGSRVVFGIPMETFDSDRSLEVVVYDSPKVVVRLKTEDGGPLRNPRVMSWRPAIAIGDEAPRVREDQFRLLRVPVHEPFKFEVSADGYQRVEQQCDKLPEGATKEIVVTLRKKKR
jgi:RNA polymerase sigma factor (sigma-70 family)